MFLSKRKGKHARHVKRTRAKLPMSAYLLYLLTLTFICTGISFSRFASTTTVEGSARIAVMASGMQCADIAVEGCPGSTSQQARIELTNYEEADGETRVSDVTLECSLTAENLTNNIPLQFAFYEDANRSKPLDTVTLSPGEKSSKALYLVISWPSDYNDGSYAFEIDAVRIIATATQVD